MNRLIKLDELVDLETGYEPDSIDLSGEYWTPEEPGEVRRMIFAGIETRSAPDHQNPEKQVPLECVVFVLPGKKGNHKTVFNGSRRLVGVFENGDIEKGTAVQITYNGKKKNRTNANQSDDWSVQTLKKKGSK